MGDDDNEKFEEEQFILRVPEHLAEILRKKINDQDFDNFELDIQETLRDSMGGSSRATMFLDGEEHVGARVSLPCYIETFKTYDKQNYYKSSDISQMVVITDDEDAADEMVGKEFNPDGLTPGTRNIRRRRAARHPELQREEVMQFEDKIKHIMDKAYKGDDLEILYLPLEDAPAGEPQASSSKRSRPGSPSPHAHRAPIPGSSAALERPTKPPVAPRPPSPTRSLASRASQVSLNPSSVSRHSRGSQGDSRSASKAPSSDGEGEGEGEGDLSGDDNDAKSVAGSEMSGDDLKAALDAIESEAECSNDSDDSDESDEGDKKYLEDPKYKDLVSRQAALKQELAQSNSRVEQLKLDREKQANTVLKGRVTKEIESLESNIDEKEKLLETLASEIESIISQS